jgi:hypothetical protein
MTTQFMMWTITLTLEKSEINSKPFEWKIWITFRQNHLFLRNNYLLSTVKPLSIVPG